MSEHKGPPPITPERARAIWAAKGPYGGWPKDAYTKDEDAYICSIWKTMPGHASWASALMTIMNDGLKPGDFVSLLRTGLFGRIAVAFPYGDFQLYSVRYYHDGAPMICPDPRCVNAIGELGADDWRADARTCPICNRNVDSRALARIPEDQLALMRAEGLLKE
jgi:hypothetical protein